MRIMTNELIFKIGQKLWYLLVFQLQFLSFKCNVICRFQENYLLKQ